MDYTIQYLSTDEHEALLLDFNNRDSDAFGRVYSLFYTELNHFASNLYRNIALEPGDAVQDVFMNLWQLNKVRFEGLINIKAYLFIAIRNHFRSYLSRCKSVDKYKKIVVLEYDCFEADVIESEVFTAIYERFHLLPTDSAQILTMLLQGWNADEVAQKLGQTRQTIYNKKSKAIDILKRGLNGRELMILISLLK